MGPEPTTVTYQPGLDGLRGIAILLVLGLHLLGPGILPGGYIGVDLFFTLSGYLITSLLLAENAETGTISLRGFYARRARRLWPALYCLLLVVTVAQLALSPDDPGRIDTLFGVIGGATATLTWIIAFHLSSGGLLQFLWSLSVEEQFYLLWPLGLMLLLSTRRPWAPPLALIAVLTAAILWRLHLVLPDNISIVRIYFALDTHADAILIGCLLALPGAEWLRSASRHLWPLAALGFAFVALLLPVETKIINTWGYTAIGLMSAVLVSAAIEAPLPRRLLSTRWLVGLGRISYSLYLWHYPISQWLLAIPMPTPMRWAVTLALSLGVAYLSWRLVEQPFRRHRTQRPALETAASA